jgi:hypothetical protein
MLWVNSIYTPDILSAFLFEVTPAEANELLRRIEVEQSNDELLDRLRPRKSLDVKGEEHDSLTSTPGEDDPHPPQVEDQTSGIQAVDAPVDLKLTSTALKILRALHQKGADDCVRCVKRESVARLIRVKTHQSQYFKDAIKSLKQLGLAETLKGPNGGVWLTERGYKLASERLLPPTRT